MKIATEPEDNQLWTNGPTVIEVCPDDQHDWVLDIEEGYATLHCDADNCWNINTRGKTGIEALLGGCDSLIDGRFRVQVTVKTEKPRWLSFDDYDPGSTWVEVKPQTDVA